MRDLVTMGPYSVVRNPLYGFSFLGVAGLAAQTGSVTIAFLTALVAGFLFLPVVRQEEQALAQVHGATFETYRRTVPRFLLKWSLWRSVDDLTIAPKRWTQTVLDGCIMLAVIPAVRGLGWVQSTMPDLPLLRLP